MRTRTQLVEGAAAFVPADAALCPSVPSRRDGTTEEPTARLAVVAPTEAP